MNLNDDEDMLKMRANRLWSEGQSARLLEHDCHDVITDVPLPQQLTRQRKQRVKSLKQSGKIYNSKVKLTSLNSLKLFVMLCVLKDYKFWTIDNLIE